MAERYDRVKVKEDTKSLLDRIMHDLNKENKEFTYDKFIKESGEWYFGYLKAAEELKKVRIFEK